MEKEIELHLTEYEIQAVVFALSETREANFKGCSPPVSYGKLSDKIIEQLLRVYQ